MDEAGQRLSNDLIGAAGVHFAAYRLSLRGLIALPTVRNTAGIDLLVNDPRTGAHRALQVMASLKLVNFWPMSKPEKCLRGAQNAYVFLRFDSNIDSFEGFLVDAESVFEQVTANLEDYRDRGRAEFPYWGLPSDEEQREAFRMAWHTWRPVAAAPLPSVAV
jgi:hypothetical protein